MQDPFPLGSNALQFGCNPDTKTDGNPKYLLRTLLLIAQERAPGSGRSGPIPEKLQTERVVCVFLVSSYDRNATWS